LLWLADNIRSEYCTPECIPINMVAMGLKDNNYLCCNLTSVGKDQNWYVSIFPTSFCCEIALLHLCNCSSQSWWHYQDNRTPQYTLYQHYL